MEEDLDLVKVAVVVPSEEMVALVLVLTHTVEVELPLLVVQLDQLAVVLVDFFLVVMVWLLAVVLVILLKAVAAVGQVGMVVEVLVITNAVFMNQVVAAVVPVMDDHHPPQSKVH